MECPTDGCPTPGEWDSRDAMLIDDCPVAAMHHTGHAHEPNSCCPHNLQYLSTMTAAEHEELAQLALMHLADGWWAGVDTDHGGYADDLDMSPLCQRPIRRFVEDCYVGRWQLNEGFVAQYANDLAGELRLMRGWCPHCPATTTVTHLDTCVESHDRVLATRWYWLA